LSAARESFPERPALPIPGSKVHVVGFSGVAGREVGDLLAKHGLRATSFASGADAILVAGGASVEAVEEARRSGRRVLALDDLRIGRTETRSAFEVTEESVRVLDVELPRQAPGGRMVPAQEHAHALCMDASFLATARTVALAAREGLPCALEGETASAKTTSVRWLAWLCRQGFVRLNLNGQTDTGELVGRYVPAAGEGGWRFGEGFLPQAMREGWWLLLDEVNLAEPQVLERLNPALESPPSLVLSEHDGRRFGAGGDVPIDPRFRLFATMNPAEYAGRSVLSPAFRDRWTVWSCVDPAGEADLRAMLECLVFGVHPEVFLEGMHWRAPDSVPVYPELQAVPHIAERIGAIVTFHVSVACATGSTGRADIGRSRRERYVFTRRALLAFMQLYASALRRGVEERVAFRSALELTYVGRTAPGPDRQAMRGALAAVGIGS
jgi:hypothetical protein